jgi:hypothetical protein
MLQIASFFEGLSSVEARETAYFLSRYFKASPNLEPDGKDTFAEVFDREVEERVRGLTLEIISKIEAEIGRPAYDFDVESSTAVLDSIVDFEKTLDPIPAADQVADASSFLRSIAPPIQQALE